MAGHNPLVNAPTMNEIKSINPKVVVDVGAGDGNWGKDIRDRFPECYLIGIEIFEPYIVSHKLYEIYDKLLNNNVKDVINKITGDIILFGDVLEHMKKEDALKVVAVAVSNFAYIIINSPEGYQPQQKRNDNVYEVHVCGLTPKDFEKKYYILEQHRFPVGNGKFYFNILIKGER